MRWYSCGTAIHPHVLAASASLITARGRQTKPSCFEIEFNTMASVCERYAAVLCFGKNHNTGNGGPSANFAMRTNVDRFFASLKTFKPAIANVSSKNPIESSSSRFRIRVSAYPPYKVRAQRTTVQQNQDRSRTDITGIHGFAYHSPDHFWPG